ncbi:MAG: ubiquitin-specific protease doa4 [Vezdaea aestivalis]|nr:MAG: ubiquitin-specific protease doa4 [Vezdaea aestivalis]
MDISVDIGTLLAMAANTPRNSTGKVHSVSELNQDAKNILDGFSLHVPMKTLIYKIQEHQRASASYLLFKRPDLAFVNHIVAMDLLVLRVPQNKDFPTFATEKGPLWNLRAKLQQDLSRQQDEIEQVKVQLQALSRPKTPDQQCPTSNLDNISSSDPRNTPSRAGAVKRRPAVQPKPNGLKSKPVQQLVVPAVLEQPHTNQRDDLQERFANLRGTKLNRSTQEDSEPLRMPSPSDFQVHPNGRNELGAGNRYVERPSSLTNGVDGSRPKGPRKMPGSIVVPPAHPPKIPIHPPISMPRPPSPAYSPAHSMMQPGVNFPELHQVDYRNVSYGLEMRKGYRNQGYMSAQDDDSVTSKANSEFSDPYPKNGKLSPQGLQSLLQLRYKALLIDVRERSDFDDGHIYAQSTICIEPLCIHSEMSAAELEDSLVLSPESEQAAFLRRSSFDFVVVYDQSSLGFEDNRNSAATRSSRSNSKLRIVREALEDYSYGQPLRNKMLLLEGGLDAWVDYVGPQALSSSTTLMRRAEPDYQLQRSTVSSREDRPATLNGINSKSPPRRPMQDLSGIDNQLKQARRHAAIVPVDEDINRTLFHNHDDFLRRFPSISDIPESMMIPAMSNNVPRPGAVLAYSSFSGSRRTDPKKSVLTGAGSRSSNPPSRPAPALPRTSYSGVSTPGNYAVVNRPRPEFFEPDYKVLPKFRGLVNLTNTCYSNAVIQCLNATAPLTGWITSGTYQIANSSPALVAEAFVGLIKALNKGGDSVTAITPQQFIAAFKLQHQDFDNTDQQDALEYFSLLLDDLARAFTQRQGVGDADNLPPQFQQLSDAHTKQLSEMPIQLASRLIFNREHGIKLSSYIDDIFRLQEVKTLECTQCKKRTRVFEHPSYATISLAESVQSKSLTLKQLFDKWAAGFEVDGSCETRGCGAVKKQVKNLFSRAPRTFMVYLNRGWVGQRNSRTYQTKLETVVQYPLDSLDLTEYFMEPLPAMNKAFKEELKTYHPRGPALLAEPEVATTGPYLYELYGVVLHHGATVTQGHYTAFIRGERPHEWFHFNDGEVSRLSKPQMAKLNRDPRAYLLFYRRNNLL